MNEWVKELKKAALPHSKKCLKIISLETSVGKKNREKNTYFGKIVSKDVILSICTQSIK